MSAPADPRAGLEFVRRTLYALNGGDDGTEHGGCAVDDLADFAAVVLALTEHRADLDCPGVRAAVQRMALKAQSAAERIDAAHRGMNLIARVGIGRFLIAPDEAERAAALLADGAGRPAPHEPTPGDVAAAQRVLAALGHAWTAEEIVACLRDAEADAR